MLQSCTPARCLCSQTFDIVLLNAVAKSEAALGRQLALGSVPVFYMAQQVTTGLIQQFDTVLAGIRHMSVWLKWLYRRFRTPDE